MDGGMDGWMNLGSFCQKTCDNNDKLGCVCLKIFWNLLLLLLYFIILLLLLLCQS
jgi:hypothetical protein